MEIRSFQIMSRFLKRTFTSLSSTSPVISTSTSSSWTSSSSLSCSSGSLSSSSKCNFKKIGLVGAGQMGTGIAQVLTTVAKLPVLLYDSSQNVMNQSINLIKNQLSKEISKGKITEKDKNDALNRISLINSLNDFNDCDIIIEAIKEDEKLKIDLFKNLSELTSSNTILASNTSSIPITKMASFTKKSDKVIGMHFMNPVPVMKLVEIIKGLDTSDETLHSVNSLALLMGKTVTISKDIPGFIANRCLMPYINEAIFALYENIGSKDDIDTTMKLGCNMPMGPLTLADFIGLDTCLAILNVLHSQLGDSKYRPCPLLVQYVNAGWLGTQRNGLEN